LRRKAAGLKQAPRASGVLRGMQFRFGSISLRFTVFPSIVASESNRDSGVTKIDLFCSQPHRSFFSCAGWVRALQRGS
jgi:hypothetical protein